MPMAVAIGMEPLLCIGAMSPDQLGIGAPRRDLPTSAGCTASRWSSPSARLWTCSFPAQAEIVLEGEVLPKVRVDEGPHGESHGFYGGEKKVWSSK